MSVFITMRDGRLLNVTHLVSLTQAGSQLLFELSDGVTVIEQYATAALAAAALTTEYQVGIGPLTTTAAGLTVTDQGNGLLTTLSVVNGVVTVTQ